MTARSRPAELHCVILGGGGGTRFWPMSRAARPKQLLPLVGGVPLLVATWKRLRALVPASRIWVVAPRDLAAAMRKHLPQLLPRNLVLEPSPKDTAPAVTLVCAAIEARHPGAVVGIFPADHTLRNPRAFRKAVLAAVRAASKDALVCLGIVPDRPATGFGWLRCAGGASGAGLRDVTRFVEKPDAATARRFLRSGRYLWNGGMFVWKAARFLDEVRRTAPEILRGVTGHRAGRAAAWSKLARKSVDYAVMEQAIGVRAVPLDAGWDDVGSWDAAASLLAQGGRPGRGAPVFIDSPGTVVVGASRHVAVVGVPGAVVVGTTHALLIVARDRAEQVRTVVAELARRGRGDLL